MDLNMVYILKTKLEKLDEKVRIHGENWDKGFDDLIEMAKHIETVIFKSTLQETLQNLKIKELKVEVNELKASLKYVEKTLKNLELQKKEESKEYKGKDDENIQSQTKNSDDVLINVERSLVACKGRGGNYQNINAWLQDKLKPPEKFEGWKILPIKDSFMKRVLFTSIHDREYILKNKKKWDNEGTWIWHEFYSKEEKKLKCTLTKFGLEQQKHGKKVFITNRWLEIDNERWVYVEKMNTILNSKVENSVISV